MDTYKNWYYPAFTIVRFWRHRNKVKKLSSKLFLTMKCFDIVDCGREKMLLTLLLVLFAPWGLCENEENGSYQSGMFLMLSLFSLHLKSTQTVHKKEIVTYIYSISLALLSIRRGRGWLFNAQYVAATPTLLIWTTPQFFVIVLVTNNRY